MKDIERGTLVILNQDIKNEYRSAPKGAIGVYSDSAPIRKSGKTVHLLNFHKYGDFAIPEDQFEIVSQPPIYGLGTKVWITAASTFYLENVGEITGQTHHRFNRTVTIADREMTVPLHFLIPYDLSNSIKKNMLERAD